MVENNGALKLTQSVCYLKGGRDGGDERANAGQVQVISGSAAEASGTSSRRRFWLRTRSHCTYGPLLNEYIFAADKVYKQIYTVL